MALRQSDSSPTCEKPIVMTESSFSVFCGDPAPQPLKMTADARIREQASVLFIPFTLLPCPRACPDIFDTILYRSFCTAVPAEDGFGRFVIFGIRTLTLLPLP